MINVVELRQYTLHPGRRDDLIELFDREFVETQEACGMVVIGQFRDLDDPDRFVWLRGFADMESRREALTAFYGGPVWKANSAETWKLSRDARIHIVSTDRITGSPWAKVGRGTLAPLPQRTRL